MQASGQTEPARNNDSLKSTLTDSNDSPGSHGGCRGVRSCDA